MGTGRQTWNHCPNCGHPQGLPVIDPIGSLVRCLWDGCVALWRRLGLTP